MLVAQNKGLRTARKYVAMFFRDGVNYHETDVFERAINLRFVSGYLFSAMLEAQNEVDDEIKNEVAVLKTNDSFAALLRGGRGKLLKPFNSFWSADFDELALRVVDKRFSPSDRIA